MTVDELLELVSDYGAASWAGYHKRAGELFAWIVEAAYAGNRSGSEDVDTEAFWQIVQQHTISPV